MKGETLKLSKNTMEELVIPCLCDQSDWSNFKRLSQIRIKPNRRRYPLIFKVCGNCGYVVGLQDLDPVDKLERSSLIVRTIATMLKWKLAE
jgi:hypothetical protein